MDGEGRGLQGHGVCSRSGKYWMYRPGIIICFIGRPGEFVLCEAWPTELRTALHRVAPRRTCISLQPPPPLRPMTSAYARQTQERIAFTTVGHPLSYRAECNPDECVICWKCNRRKITNRGELADDYDAGQRIIVFVNRACEFSEPPPGNLCRFFNPCSSNSSFFE